MKPAIHSIFHKKSGISIEEKEGTNGHIAIVVHGLPEMEPEQMCTFQYLLHIWKYGLTSKKPRKTKK